MVIKKYSDLKKIRNDAIVDLSELSSNQFKMAISFLAGLTYQKGSLTKISKYKFLISLGE